MKRWNRIIMISLGISLVGASCCLLCAMIGLLHHGETHFPYGTPEIVGDFIAIFYFFVGGQIAMYRGFRNGP